MCGIAGVMRFDGQHVVEALLRAMADTLIHRGPDGDGYFALGPVGLAHRRLAIIDVAGSPQPMASDDGRYTMAFNGEIVNYRELRERYRLRCRSNGDTEVLLRLLIEHGPDALKECRGQFAFALFDREMSTLLVARDRMGILPLFYSVQPWGFVFGSEAKSLRPALGQLTLDEESLADYLMQRFVPAPHTLYAGVKKVLPGAWMRIGTTGVVAEGRYWSLDERRDMLEISADEAVDELDRLMILAVEESLEADVPVGAYLSGGVDSSLTVSLAARANKAGQLSTFAAGFSDNPKDERHHARRVSKLLGTDHHEVLVRPEDFFGDLEKLIWFRDLPLSEPADTAVASLARLASDHVKVVISGEGSDELFGGYPKYRMAKQTIIAGRFPAGIRRPVLSMVRRTARNRNERLATALRTFEAESEADRIRSWFAPYTVPEVKRLVGRRPRSFDDVVELSGDAVRKFGLVDLASWLPDNLLERGDRMTMASSIELRPPFLDARVVEFALSLPSEFKVRDGVTKWVVKQTAKRYVEADLIDRPKVGFYVPFDEWFRTNLADQVRDLLCGPTSHVAEWLDGPAVRRLVDDHIAGKGHFGKQLWPLVSLEMWARGVLDGHRPGTVG